MIVLYVDIDGVICNNTNGKYEEAKPIKENAHRGREALTMDIRPSPGFLLAMPLPPECLYESDPSMRRMTQTSFRHECAS